MVLQTMAVPVMSFDTWAMYMPTWQEVMTTILPVAYGVILIMISYRYLPIFPQEAELNPIEPAAPAAGAQGAEAQQPAAPASEELKPAQA
jgi:molybdopterin-containing oxidoreductase family membrane subunit